jgi:hypothetical protein
MQEGAWINYETGKIFDITDHELWIREGKNADRLGVPKSVQKNFLKYSPMEDRIKFLLYLMKNAPLMRMRGHGSDITFEYYNRSSKDPIESVQKAAHKYGGDYSTLNIFNLATKEVTSMLRKDFDEIMDGDGYEGVMRVASRKFDARSRKMIADLLNIAKEVASS